MTTGYIMKTALKHLSVDLAVVLGNTFLSYLMIPLWYILVVFFQSIGSSDIMQFITLFFVCALQISINILLYKMLLKKFYEPAEHKNPFLYLLLPMAIAVLWVCMLRLLDAVGYDFDFNLDPYLWTLISFLPVVLLTLLPPLNIYRLGFKKRVGEMYCVYVLSIFGVLMFPSTAMWVYTHIG